MGIKNRLRGWLRRALHAIVHEWLDDNQSKGQIDLEKSDLLRDRARTGLGPRPRDDPHDRD